MTWDNLPAVPDIRLNEHQFRIIQQKVRERQDFLLEFDIRNHFRFGPVKYHNVIATIRGAVYPDEIVMTGGHLDSYDVATGGVDCGVGVAPAMEAARLIAKAMAATGERPKRTMKFCLWTFEEAGIVGSRHWVHSNREKWPNIINYFNRDYGPLVPTGIAVPATWVEDMTRIAAPLNAFNPEFPFVVREGTPINHLTAPASSDHHHFIRNRIPAIMFSIGDPRGYNFDYSEVWHTERDTYDKSIPVYMDHASIVNAVILWGIANLPNRLPAEGVYLD
jgi:Zn-dependent M28 family amino/carboxypeptidase